MTGSRRLEANDSVYEAVAAWSGVSGLSLCYFVALEGEAASAGDRGDRRAALEPGEALDSLGDERLVELLASGAPLTETERRFETPDGGRWLAQNVGPVWAPGAAAGLTGVLFTDLTGSGGRFHSAGGPIAEMSPRELLDLWVVATGGDEPSS